MEKYAVDIDKVLDEFEENEALKIGIVCEQPLKEESFIDRNCLASFETFPENTEPIFLNNSTSNCDNQIQPSDKHFLLENQNLILQKDFSGLSSELENSHEDDNCENFTSASNISNLKSACVDNKNTKHLNFNIFYKPLESEHVGNNFSTVNGPSNSDFEENVCNLVEEVLCVSVQEITSGSKNLTGAQSIHNEVSNSNSRQGSQVFEKSLCSYDLNDRSGYLNLKNKQEIMSALQDENVCSDDKFLLCSDSINVSSENNSKSCDNILEKNDKFESENLVSDYVIDETLNTQSSQTIYSDSVDGCKYSDEKDIETAGHTSKVDFSEIEKVDDSKTYDVSSSKHEVSYFSSSSLQNNMEGVSKNSEDKPLRTDDTPTSSELISENQKGEDLYFENLTTLNSLEASNVNYDIKTDFPKVKCASIVPNDSKNNQNENKISITTSNEEQNSLDLDSCKNVCIHISESWKMDSKNTFHPINSAVISQDDDSGVSSQEDISGNSPSELPDNQPTNINPKYDSDEIDSNLVPFQNHKELADRSRNIDDSIECISSLNKSGMPKIDKPNENESTSTLESTENSNTFAGARPKIDYPNMKDNTYTDCGTTDLNSPANESLHMNNSNNVKPNENFEVTCNSKESLNFECRGTANNKLSGHETILDSNENNIFEQSEESIAEKQILNLNKTDETVLSDSDSKNNEFSRLQRPTSLNLPSLQLSTTEIPEEDSKFSDNGELITESIPPVISFDDQVNEVPHDKQQSQIGFVKPYWIPDGEAPNCMHCAMKFTVIRRRHHCRACGKVLCSRCCNQRAHLPYMNKEDRICQPCAEILSTSNNLVTQNDQLPMSPDSLSSSSCGSSPSFSPVPELPSSKTGDKNIWRPHPNNPDDYCSTIPPLQQMELSGQKPPPTVMVPIGVLKRGNKRRREPKQVIFSDGIRPGGDLTDLTEPTESVPAYRRLGRKRMDKLFSGEAKEASFLSSPKIQQKYSQKRFLVSDDEGSLPPIVLQTDIEDEDKKNVDWNYILQLLQDQEKKPIKFILLKNLHIFVKLSELDCCYGKECWCFTSHGFCSVGQDEVVILLERIPGEINIPRDIFKIFTHIYDNASKGITVEDLGHVIFSEKILDNNDHRGFLFVRPTFQCLSKLVLPAMPYLVAILINKWEVPWAKVFPLRLMLRLGAECRYYPCSLLSTRHRKPVFFEIGQTIMSVLADLRNYQFTLPVIPGLVVHMEEKKTCVNIPRNRYDKVMKVLKTNNVEHVLPLGSNFSTEADSHLVCIQKEENDYQTQAINIENTVRKVTGASFIVFSGALKSSSGLSAKFSIVEDGLLIQIPQETMVALHVALRDMRDLTIKCGHVGASDPEEIVIIQWTKDDKKFNIGISSPIDGRSLEGVSNLRIHTSTDYASENYLIRWTEIFFIEFEQNKSSIQSELVDPCRMAETVAQSCCMALTPFLQQLADAELMKIGLRVTLDTERDKVGYDIGSCGKALPSMYMNTLDSNLIPIILRLSSSTQNEKLSFELIFHILLK